MWTQMGGWLKQGEKEGEKSKSNGGTTSRSKRQGNGDRRSTDKGDRENKRRTQNRSKASKCVSVKKIN